MPNKEKALQKAAKIPNKYRGQYRSAMAGNSRTDAINSFCRECMGWKDVAAGIKSCTAITCPLYPYRPYQKNKTKQRGSK
ncbi:MAG: hypothetical protein JEZ07_08060 [Phycisphaerae bacterium]|nr:hypothetical protein [Phycisphaerae bacterium]